MIVSAKRPPKTKSLEAFVDLTRHTPCESWQDKEQFRVLQGLRISQGLRSCGRIAQIGLAHIALLCCTRNQLPLYAKCNKCWMDGGGLPLGCHMLEIVAAWVISLVALSWPCPERFKIQNSSLSNQHAARLWSGDMVRSPASR